MSCTPFVLYPAPGSSKIYIQQSFVGFGRFSGGLDLKKFSMYLFGCDFSCIVLNGLIVGLTDCWSLNVTTYISVPPSTAVTHSSTWKPTKLEQEVAVTIV